MMTKPRLAAVALCALIPGCFNPTVDPDAETDGSDGAPTSDGTGAPTAGTSDSMASTSSDGPQTTDIETSETLATETDTLPGETESGTAPEIVEFTVDGEDENIEVISSRAFAMVASVEDADGDLLGVEFFRDGDLLAVGVPNGGTFEAEWIVSGASENGTGVVEAVATDGAGNTTTASINADVGVPDGGLVETWDFDGGELSSVYAVAVEPNGAEVVVVGNNEVGGTSTFRADRVQGPNWADTTANGSRFASGVVWRAGGYVVAGDLFESPTERNTQIRVYDESGNQTASELFDPTPGGELNYPISMEADADGDLYVLGSYLAPGFRSYLMKATSGLDPEWDRDLTGSPQTDGDVFAYGFSVRADGETVVVGSRPAGTPKAWIGRYDEGGSLVDQIVLLDDYETSTLYDATWVETGGFIVAGATDAGDGWRSFLRRYDDDFSVVWTADGAANDSFALSVDTDDFGNFAFVSAETCGFDQASAQFVDCRMVVRKNNLDGDLVWQFLSAGGGAEFDGPLLFLPGFKPDITTDRIGYVYATGFHQAPVGGGATRREWWVQQLNP